MTSVEELEKRLTAYAGGEPATAKERYPYPNSMLYARPKVGKTVTACSAGTRNLLLGFDTGWTSLKDWPEIAEKTVVEECSSLRHFELFAEAILKDIPRYREFDHIILDPINMLVTQYLDYINEYFKPSAAADNQRVHWIPTESRTELPAFTTSGRGDYMAVRNWIRPKVFQLTMARRMVTWVVHATDSQESSVLRPSLPGKVYEVLAASVDFIGFMEAKNANQVTIEFNPSSKVDAGSRSRALHGKKIAAENYADTINKWRAGEI